MMNFGREPRKLFVPPGCPAAYRGDEAHIDLLTAPFDFVVGDCGTGPDGKRQKTEAYGWFDSGRESTEDEPGVECGLLVVPIDSTAAKNAHGIAHDHDHDPDGSVRVSSADDPRVARMRQMFCERVVACHGIVIGPEGQECWALGESALAEVLGRFPAEDA